ncbi:MAG: SDR family oxidoreductase [Phycisphaerae bacterium]
MSADLFSLAGRTALVTGSSRGLGRTMARGLGRAGAALVLNGRNEERLAAAVTALAREGLEVRGAPFDVTDSAAVGAALDDLERDGVAVDILVNNAGIQRRDALEDLTDDDWRAVLETNLTGAFLVARRVVRGILARGTGRGKIINICSLMSTAARPTTGNYAAAKGGLAMLTRAMAVEWGGRGVQANAIAPGYFETEMTRTLVADEAFDAWVRGRTPAGRWGDPEELVGPAVFLASAASDFVNGHILYVDGGVLAAL